MKLPEFLAGKFENKIKSKLDLTESSSNPFYRQWILSGSKLNFENWLKKFNEKL